MDIGLRNPVQLLFCMAWVIEKQSQTTTEAVKKNKNGSPVVKKTNSALTGITNLEYGMFCTYLHFNTK